MPSDSESGCKLVAVQRPDVVTVEPAELVEVEDRADRIDLGPVEVGDELFEGEDLASVVLRRIGKQRKEVHQRLRQVALLAEPGQARRSVLALADLGLVG